MTEAKPRNPRFHGRTPREEACDEPGCTEAGEFRAPLTGASFDGPGRYRWLCLDHVREFNARYNYFRGMSAEEITEAQNPLHGWERATRAFAGVGDAPRWTDFKDPLEAIQARFAATRPRDRADGKPLSGDDRRDLKTLGLDIDADRRALRQAYSDRVRRFHPDRNGGDRSHEKALQAAVEAYQRLKRSPAFV
jgi:hypothetical protein